jgi:hypothetical protein
LGGAEGPSVERLEHAALCLASLDALVVACAHALDAVPEGHELFPPRPLRRWFLEGISFELVDPTSAQALFTHDDPDGKWEYVYVLFVVDISKGRPGKASALVR